MMITHTSVNNILSILKPIKLVAGTIRAHFMVLSLNVVVMLIYTSY